MSAIGLDLAKNISLFTIPAAFALALVPHQIAIGMASLAVYDNSQPRSFTERVMKADNLDKPTKLRILRAQGASDNGFETLGLYAAAVVAANTAKVDTELLNLLTLGYIASRLAFNFAYIQLGENRSLSYVRTLIWGAGIGSIMTLFIQAGKALY